MESSTLEGKWWIPSKVELCFNGSVVQTPNVRDFLGDLDYWYDIDKAFFENGTCTLVDHSSGEKSFYSYSFANNLLTIGFISARVTKLTKNEAIVEETVAEDLAPYTARVGDGTVFDSYKGFEIFGDDPKYPYHFWYKDKNGKAVLCASTVQGNWFDTARVYFKAE